MSQPYGPILGWRSTADYWSLRNQMMLSLTNIATGHNH
jgi:hypothetical protein